MVMGYSVSIVSIVVAAVVTFLLGWLWYSPVLFGTIWMKEAGITKGEMTKAKKKSMMGSMIGGLIGQLIMAWVLAVFISATGALGASGGMTIAFWAWLGFVATIGLGSVLWENKSAKLFWINMIHWLVVLLVQGAIIGAWM